MSGYYTPTGNPGNQTRGLSQLVRQEFQIISDGMGALLTGTDIGSANSYVLSFAPEVITTYFSGLMVKFQAANANTGASTLNINGIGQKSIVRANGAALAEGDILDGQIVQVFYDAVADQFQLPASATGGTSPNFSGTAGGTIDLLTGAAVASAATINLNGTTGNFVHITGTTAITAVTLTRGPRQVVFDGSLTLTHNATTCNLPGGANIQTAAGDRATFWSDGTSVYCIDYTKADGRAIAAPPMFIVRDEKAANTAGGTFTSGAWQTRTLNTVQVNSIGSGAALATNQITLSPGTYLISASAPAFSVNAHQVKLRNVTDGTDTLIGTSENAGVAAAEQSRSMLTGVFTIAAQKVFEIQHQCATTGGTNGFGRQANLGVTEVYTSVAITKLAAS